MNSNDIISLPYNYLIESNLFTESELGLLCEVCGYTFDTLDNAVYAKFGYPSLCSYFRDNWDALPTPCDDLLRIWLNPWEVEDEELYNRLFVNA